MNKGYPIGIGTNARTAKPTIVYVSSPHTLGSQSENVNRQIVCGEFLSNYGFAPILPLLAYFWDIIFPHPDSSFWLEYGFVFLEKADCLLRLDGKSEGADLEVEYAKARGIPIFYSTTELLMFYQKKNPDLA